ncbi:hypothetical protein AVEN_155980-1, partial [Araneus ventricosus]
MNGLLQGIGVPVGDESAVGVARHVNDLPKWIGLKLESSPEKPSK